ncbi:phage tail assembly chaperone G [Lactococcus lactis]
MAKLEITLHEKGGDVTYKQNHVSGQKFLDYLELEAELEQGTLTVVQAIEKRLEYVASLFSDDGLTAQQIIEGLDPWEVSTTLGKITDIILGIEGTGEKKEQ